METFFQKMGLAPAAPSPYADCFRKAKAAMAARGDGILRFEDAGIFTWLTKALCRIRSRAMEDPDEGAGQRSIPTTRDACRISGRETTIVQAVAAQRGIFNFLQHLGRFLTLYIC